MITKRYHHLRQVYSAYRAFQADLPAKFNLKVDDLPVPATGPPHSVKRAHKQQPSNKGEVDIFASDEDEF